MRTKVVDIDPQEQLYVNMKILSPLLSIYLPEFIDENQAGVADNAVAGTKSELVAQVRVQICDLKVGVELAMGTSAPSTERRCMSSRRIWYLCLFKVMDIVLQKLHYVPVQTLAPFLSIYLWSSSTIIRLVLRITCLPDEVRTGGSGSRAVSRLQGRQHAREGHRTGGLGTFRHEVGCCQGAVQGCGHRSAESAPCRL